MLLGGNLLLSGSAIFAVCIVQQCDVECCCSEAISGNEESFDCGKNCCVFTIAKVQNYIVSVPGSLKLFDKLQHQILICDFGMHKDFSACTDYKNPAESNLNKIYIVISEFRI